jgi:hypothetical protein
MLWNKNVKYLEEPFESESELEMAIIEVSQQLFGVNRVYIDVKRKIGLKGSIRNIPDGYLLDLSSLKTPVVYVVEVELASHDPLKHIAVQVLEFSLSFETSPTIVKSIIKNTLFPATGVAGNRGADFVKCLAPSRRTRRNKALDPTALVGCPQASLLPSAVLAGQRRESHRMPRLRHQD